MSYLAESYMYYELQIDIRQTFGITEIPKIKSDVSFINGGIITECFDLPLVFGVSSSSEYPPSDIPGIRIPVLSGRVVKALRDFGVNNIQEFP
ncbi:MAG: hypothetical protein OEW87_13845, partial [Flavobacteriaceae bacterium]|nr:hypothetical protein [Flavobacteriaceae bacterium]